MELSLLKFAFSKLVPAELWKRLQEDEGCRSAVAASLANTNSSLAAESQAVNVTQPRFSGMDAFGYTSFLAYARIPDISFDYEFRLQFQLANHHSALQDNLIFFTGQKGRGLSGDDFLAVGLRGGSVVYTYNLGSGTANISSDPLDLSRGIHTVHLGRSFRAGWLKVDDHENKSVISPGKLVGLNVFGQFYVGGCSEYTPELLPDGADFKNGFQAVTALAAGREHSARRPFPPVTLSMPLHTTAAKELPVCRCLVDTPVTVLWGPLESTVNKEQRLRQKYRSPVFNCVMYTFANGSVQLRYNLGDRTIILETLQKVTITGSTWHVIKAGRDGAEGYLDLDGINVTGKAIAKMSYLDTNTDFYIGGVSSLNLVNPMATANEPMFATLGWKYMRPVCALFE
ncbi:hypothetical protein CB1_001873003 [Camelus ferus]|nr:hypothetical protein CB1_001873003 [Camelus ferus]